MTTSADAYPGQALGLPQEGRGSMARMPRRILGIFIDWAAALILSNTFFPDEQLMPLVILAVIHILFIPTIGGSPGHRIAGLRMQRVTGGWTGIWRPIVRTLLLILVIPAVIWNKDNRGLHDVIAGTVLVRA